MRSPRRILARATAVAGAGLLAAAAIGTAPGAASADDFVNGSGNASAQILRAGPAAGHLALAPQIGLSLADFLDTVGRGDSRSAELGALAISLPPEVASALPAVTANSESAPVADGGIGATTAGLPVKLGALTQHADAAKTPLGHATTTVADVDIPGLLTVSGATADASAGVAAGASRQARGAVDVGSISLAGGQVVLRGLHWEAVQTTDTSNDPKVSGGFSLGGLTIAGQAVPVPSDAGGLRAVFDQVNAVLAPTGLVVDLPALSNQQGVATIGPLAVRLVNSPLGRQLIAPVVGGLQPVREPITGTLAQQCPQCTVALLVADVVTGVVSGGGRLDVEIGGASAYTEGTKYDAISFDFAGGLGGSAPDSFGGDLPSSAASSAGDLGSGTPSLGSATPSLGPSRAGAAGSGAAKPPSPARSNGGRAAGQASELASAPGGLSKGDGALAVGIVGLLGAAALAAADLRSLRTARRTIPT